MLIKTGDLTVFESGTVRTGIIPELKFQFDDLTFQFVFKMDNSREENLIEPVVASETKTLTMNLTNHDNPIGSGIALPLRIGTYQGKVLYVSFETRKVSGHLVWAVEYTFYIGGNDSE